MKLEHISRLTAILVVAAIDVYGEDRWQTKRIVVSIPDRKLVLLDGDKVLRVYDVAVGKASTPTPQGDFRIINRDQNPTWYGPSVVVPPGKDNPLGTRWMGLSFKGYGIHGTNAPSSVGKAASHGCIRMRQADLEELFGLVEVGMPVELRGERPQILLANAN